MLRLFSLDDKRKLSKFSKGNAETGRIHPDDVFHA